MQDKAVASVGLIGFAAFGGALLLVAVRGAGARRRRFIRVAAWAGVRRRAAIEPDRNRPERFVTFWRDESTARVGIAHQRAVERIVRRGPPRAVELLADPSLDALFDRRQRKTGACCPRARVKFVAQRFEARQRRECAAGVICRTRETRDVCLQRIDGRSFRVRGEDRQRRQPEVESTVRGALGKDIERLRQQELRPVVPCCRNALACPRQPSPKPATMMALRRSSRLDRDAMVAAEAPKKHAERAAHVRESDGGVRMARRIGDAMQIIVPCMPDRLFRLPESQSGQERAAGHGV